MNSNQYVAIMAGGIGSRFWPMSRQKLPKQFLDVLNTGQTLLQNTYQRFVGMVPPENIFVITYEEYAPLVAKQLPLLPESNILKEPSRKSTAPCVAYMAFKLLKRHPEASFIVSPSDHLILDQQGFAALTMRGLQFAEENHALVTLGITPTYPNTRYGYIQYEQEPVADHLYHVKTFTEKPNLELAKTFLASGDFLWNAGIFLWKASAVAEAFEQYLPEMYEVFAAEKEHFDTDAEYDAISRIYPQCTNISIDFGIMEKANNVHIIPATIGWSDLGTWNSAYDNMDKDYLGNAVYGKNVMVIDATRNMVHVPHHKLVILQGIDDCIVVDTPDVLLISKKETEYEIKDYMAEVKRKKGEKFM